MVNRGEGRIFFHTKRDSVATFSLVWDTAKTFIQGQIIAYASDEKTKQLVKSLKDTFNFVNSLCIPSIS